MKNTVLLVEDDMKLRMTVEDYLITNGFDVITAADGLSAIKLFLDNIHILDIVLLDGMLPKLDGFDVLRKIKAESNIPVIMLSARESEKDQLTGLRLGADNYITKPFLLSVLKEHIYILLNRNSQKQNFISAGALKLYPDSRKVVLNDIEIDTTPKEYDTLLYFVENEKRVLDRNKILDAVWGMDYYGDLRTVDTIVKQLRKKLTNEYPYIKSVYGVGYYFEV